jgi:NADPH-dependent ferric siderophore reductase
MASAKGLILDTLGRPFMREAHIAATRDLGERMRVIEVEGAALTGASWTPGDKIQVLLPSRDVRTYTPINWNAQQGRTEIVAFEHGESPGAVWSRTASVGDTLRFVGPQRSLQRSARPALVFGDETSFGVALALARAQPTQPLHAVFEVGASARGQVATDLGLASVDAIERRADDVHLHEVAKAIATWLVKHPGAELFFTGRAQSIQTLRRHLRDAGVRASGNSKAYWSVGKRGLD